MSLFSDKSRILKDWSGILNVNGLKITMVFHVTQDEEGVMSATLDSTDQGVTGVSVDQVHFENQLLQLKINRMQAQYTGTLDPNEDQMVGVFTQQDKSFPFTLQTKIPLKNRPQEPKAPFPYTEEDVSYDNKEAEITLSASLTHP